MYNPGDIHCLLCTEKKHDYQPHSLQCKAIRRKLSSVEVVRGQILYMDVYVDHINQMEVTAVFSKLIDIKKTMSENCPPTLMDPKTSYILHSCTVNYSSGK